MGAKISKIIYLEFLCRDGFGIICSALHELIEGCVLVLKPCYTTNEANAIKQRQTKLMNLAMQILIPKFDFVKSCNESTLDEYFPKTITPITTTLPPNKKGILHYIKVNNMYSNHTLAS